jgi:hypothetical protein
MAKTQTFGDKLKKQKQQELVNVKVVHTVRTDKGSLRFLEKFVKVKDVNEVTNIDVKNL